jgi:xylan 1,4-beta-xylosidase
MYGMMKGNRVAVNSDRMYPLFAIRDSGVRKPATDIGAIAANNERSATAMIWNYHDDDVAGEAATVQLQCKGINAGQVKLTQYRIDADHSNSYEVWKKMGSPQQPTSEQVTQLEKAGQLQQTGSSTEIIKDGLLQLTMQVPRQGIVFLKMDW